MMLRLGLPVAAAIAILDQLSKAWILDFFDNRPTVPHFVPVTGFFNLALTMNRGMSFGLFNNDAAFNAIVFTIVAVIIVGGLLAWLWRVVDPLLAVAIGLVIGGALGNVADRLCRDAVVDFLDFHLREWHFYVFNLADAAISIGVGLIVIDSLLSRREAPN
jgi:signal peptidase II